jgi:hypothetical protein
MPRVNESVATESTRPRQSKLDRIDAAYAAGTANSTSTTLLGTRPLRSGGGSAAAPNSTTVLSSPFVERTNLTTERPAGLEKTLKKYVPLRV